MHRGGAQVVFLCCYMMCRGLQRFSKGSAEVLRFFRKNGNEVQQRCRCRYRRCRRCSCRVASMVRYGTGSAEVVQRWFRDSAEKEVQRWFRGGAEVKV